MSLVQICGQQPNQGVGYKFWRKTWPTDSYYEIAEVKLKDPAHGKIWGFKTWRGEK
jgi:hypothetical protein